MCNQQTLRIPSVKHWREYEYPSQPFVKYRVMRDGPHHLKKIPLETREVLGLYWLADKLRMVRWDGLRGEPLNPKRRS
jgi:hypothetical protein